MLKYLRPAGSRKNARMDWLARSRVCILSYAALFRYENFTPQTQHPCFIASRLFDRGIRAIARKLAIIRCSVRWFFFFLIKVGRIELLDFVIDCGRIVVDTYAFGMIYLKNNNRV